MSKATSRCIIKVCLVEDDLAFQNALAEALHDTPDMQLQSVASSRGQGLEMLAQPPADVLLVDLGLPDGSGIDIIRAASERWPQCNIMVSTAFGGEMHVMHSLEAGATGYLLKDSAPHNIVSEIRLLHQGGSPISPLIARQLLMRFRQKSPPVPNLPLPPQATLSTRERQVLDYITKGFTADEIAALMSVSRHTVRTFVRRVYTKLAVSSKAEAIHEAIQQGLLRP
ncbi:response regulator [Variovorax ginsengisoli]|uniref:DNA-binding NarL/FixJ family response regulator n=1 Tax=Variovorax ginsengisoli TaxID=363844 RepID=A0ABT9S9L6_9BURK|nr:response regulator transcription factor [Variovorax ginsengisoli]MDP9901049.1 DNA-binding NarL/FixJ family response regulator [Variovorax ginsengisoli]